ncbi:MAG: PEP-CTERM sorting domain-containing protein, partial [Pirellulales bacterium]
GGGAATVDGDFIFDLSAAGTTLGDNWAILDVASLTETFGSTFTASSTQGSFSDLGGGLWQIVENAATYRFSTTNGVLQVVPEPTGIVAVLSGLGILAVFSRRRA